MSAPRPAAVIVLAAGGGTRMKSETLKVLHPIGGRSMVGHVAGAPPAASARSTSVVGGRPPARAGRGRTSPSSTPDVLLAVQDEQHGTGHAVRVRAGGACRPT